MGSVHRVIADVTPGGVAPSALRVVRRLTPQEVAQVRDLVEAATRADGHPALSDHVQLHLPVGGDADVRHVLATSAPDGPLVGYAHLDVTDAVEGASAELVVHPAARRAGVGRLLVTAVLAHSPDGRLRLWAHGEHPGAQALAASLGFRRARSLWQMRLTLLGAGAVPLPEPVAPEGVRLRTFAPGADDAAWVALNARAFADHPEQGRWGLQDLALRVAEEWFDPAGFFLAERAGRLVGFHWTKVHGERHAGSSGADHGVPHAGSHVHGLHGEVYVVGVDPAEQGHGLGPWLTVVGLQHLRDQGLHEAMLYVDEDNTRAVAVYERLGFRHVGSDVSYAR